MRFWVQDVVVIPKICWWTGAAACHRAWVPQPASQGVCSADPASLQERSNYREFLHVLQTWGSALVPPEVKPGRSEEACPSSSVLHSVEVALASECFYLASFSPIFPPSSRVAKLYSHLGPILITFLPNLGFGTNSSILALVGDFLLWNLKSFSPQGTKIYSYILENSIVVPEPVFYFFWSNEVSVLYFDRNNSKMYSVIFLAILQIINIISCLRFINLVSCKRKKLNNLIFDSTDD